MKKLLLVTFASAALIGLGCSASTEFDEEAPQKKPAKNTEVKHIISIQKAISDIPPTEVIGGLYKNAIKILVEEYLAAELADERYQRVYENVLLKELGKAGYNCVSKNVLFDTAKTQPRFLLGAVITEARLNDYVYYSSHELIVIASFSEALLDIRWELYDTGEKKIVYFRKELGTTKRADNKLDAYSKAMRISFRNFLSGKELLDAVKRHLINYPDQQD